LRGLDHPDVTAYLDYLWSFIGLSTSPEAFGEWEASQPLLVETGLGYGYPAGLEELLTTRCVPEREFRQALGLTTEVLYTSLYAATNEPRSKRFLSELAGLVSTFGVVFPDILPFAESRWLDAHGWGVRPSPEELAVWRDSPEAAPGTLVDPK
jgi:hypothetical protein